MTYEILPIPEIVQKLEPRILSLVVTDIKTRRLVGLKKEGFEDLLRKAGTAYGDYTFRSCLTREGFQAIPETIISRERQMMVVVEGRRPRCWGCRQLGHIAKFCSPKDQRNATTTTATTATIVSEQPTKGTKGKDPGQVQSKTNDHPKAGQK